MNCVVRVTRSDPRQISLVREFRDKRSQSQRSWKSGPADCSSSYSRVSSVSVVTPVSGQSEASRSHSSRPSGEQEEITTDTTTSVMGGSAHLPLLLLLVSVLALSCRGQQLSSNQVYKTRRLPGLDVCGKGILNFDEKIINGKPAELGAYPWMANIGYTKTPDGSKILWNCGGSLITDQYVITAAHCVHPSVIRTRRLTYYVRKVRLGDLDLNPDVQDGATPTDYDIEKIISHDYSNTRKENDIALIKLKDKVTFTRLIKPICLPPPEFHENLYLGFLPTVAGWGTTVIPGQPKPSGPKETRLLEAEVEIKDTEGCRRNLTSTLDLRSAVIDHRVVCAASSGKDACQGDSGGPLMLLQNIKRYNSTKLGNYFLMGIVSYGYGCAFEGYPGVYTRVSEYMSWVLDNMDI